MTPSIAEVAAAPSPPVSAVESALRRKGEPVKLRAVPGEKSPRGGEKNPPPPPAGPPLPPRRRRRLGNLQNVRTALADTFHALEAGELDTTQARARGYLLTALADIIAGSDLERRISDLERGDL